MTLRIRLCNANDLEESRLSGLTDLINRVYAEAEDGMWQAGFQRVQQVEVIDLIKAGKLIFAEKNGQIVGSVFVTVLANGRGEFGMLVCDPTERHQGIGKKLITAAEDKCRDEGCREMQLELLYPKDWPQKTKEILKVWYPKLGYQKGPEEDFNALYPQLMPVLATECVFSTFVKKLD